MNKQSFLGEFEQMILLAVVRLGNDAPGILIREEIMSQAQRRVSRGAMYTTLERLLTKGYVTWTQAALFHGFFLGFSPFA